MSQPEWTIWKQCEHCHGHGSISTVNPAALRWRRMQTGISLREVARRLGLSAAFLSDVERGNRGCDKFLESAYVALPHESALWLKHHEK